MPLHRLSSDSLINEGGALAALLNRIDRHKPMFAADSHEPPSTTMKRFWYDTVTQGNARGLRLACDVFGADRLVYGSDYPYQLHDQYLESVTYVQNAGLDKEDVDLILDRTAARLLGIGC